MASKRNIRFEFLVGLPGSGKTTKAKELKHKYRRSEIVDFDSTCALSSWNTAKEEDKARIIRNAITNTSPYSNVDCFIMDGLFLTYEDIVRVIKATSMLFNKIEIVIHQWNEDRETCIKNDGGRRAVASTNTILHAEFNGNMKASELSSLLVQADCSNASVIKINYHRVTLKDGWERYFRGRNSIYEDGKLKSYKWCTGGSYGSCWGDHLSPVSPDEQPDFDELDNLLADICPNITFLQYKKLFKKCVSIDDSYESDYYGGGCSYRRYVCDMKMLYETLSEFGYIEN